MTTPIESAAEVVRSGLAVWDAWGGSVDQFNAWLMGTATGGPNGDGRYPMTNRAGVVVLVACPAAQVVGLTANAVVTLPASTPADGDPVVPGVAKDGTLKKFQIARRTPDMARATQFLGDEVLPSWSAQRQQQLGDGSAGLSVGDVAALIQGVSNPKIGYGAKGDGRFVYDAVSTAGSNIIESQDAPFSALDLGKKIWLSNAAANYSALASTITEYIDAKHVRIAVNAGTSFGTQYALWGTDDTVALQNWLDDLGGSGSYNFGRAGILPEGVFLTKTLKYRGRMVIKGQGRGATTLALIPGGTGLALLENANPRVDFPLVRDLTLLGNQYIQTQSAHGLYFASVPGSDATLPQTDPYPYFSDLDIDNFGGCGYYHYNRGAGLVQNINIRRGGYYGLYSQGYDTTYNNITTAGNRLTGIYFGRFGSAGNNLRNWYSFFNGTNPYQQFQGGIVDPNTSGNIAWEDSANLYLGGPQQVSAGRAQESWGPNIVIGCSGAFVTDTRIDDTGCVRPRHAQGRAQLLNVRAAVMFAGGNAKQNLVRGLYITTAVHPGENYATQAVFFTGSSAAGYPDNNIVDGYEEIGIGAYYGSGSGSYAPGRTGNDDPNGYRSNQVIINAQRIV